MTRMYDGTLTAEHLQIVDECDGPLFVGRPQ